MTALAVRTENLGKCYRLRARPPYRTLRETVTDLAIRAFRRRRPAGTAAPDGAAPPPETLWALRGASLEIAEGEIVGVIGRNGAGKSTLLKILSRITEPTEGRATLRGRVGSLLEVGTGFHPELTGRENIYLNGSILGMRRSEIARKFDAIVAFAEVERFLDTPVKHYSSGMHMRLAFAVAAHLEPEILIVDEVLAVGDLAFQRKCIGKMGEVARGGRTILFVSHNMGAVGRLCSRGILLAGGRIALDGPADEAIAAYVRELPGSEGELKAESLVVRVRFKEPDGSRLTVWRYGSDLLVEVDVRSAVPLRDPAVDLAFYNDAGVRLFAIQSDRASDGLAGRTAASFTCRCRIRNLGLACEQLTVDVGVRADRDPRYRAWWQRIETLAVSVRDAPHYTVSDVVLYPPCEVAMLETVA